MGPSSRNYSPSLRTELHWQRYSALLLLLALLLVAGLLLSRRLASAAGNDIIIYGVNQFRQIAEVNLTQGTVGPPYDLTYGTQAADQDHETGYVYYFDRTYKANRFSYWDPVSKNNTLVVRYNEALNFYPKRLAFDPDGVLYMMDSQEMLYTVRTSDGMITPVGRVTGLVTGPQEGTGDIAFAPDGTLYLNTYGNIYTVDLDTLVATPRFTNMFAGIGAGIWTGLAFCNNMLYGSVGFSDLLVTRIYSIHPDSGALTELFTSPLTLNDLTSCPVQGGPVPSKTPTVTASSSPTATPSSTPTPVPPTATATETATNVATATSIATETPTPVPPTATLTSVRPTATSTSAATATLTPVPSTATSTNAATASFTPVLPTATSTSMATPTSVATLTATAVPPTATPRRVATATPTPIPSTIGEQDFIIYLPLAIR